MRESRTLSPFAVALRQARLSRALSINDVTKATLLSDKQVLGLENDDYSYFYNGLFASRSADIYAAFLGVDFKLDGAPSREATEPPKLVVSIDKTGAAKNHKKRPGLFSSSVFWFLLICTLLLAYGLHSCEMIGSREQPVAVREAGSPLPMASDRSVVSDSTLGSFDDTAPEATSVERVPGNQSPTSSEERLAEETKSTNNLHTLVGVGPDAKETRFFIVIKALTSVTAKDATGKTLIDGEQQPIGGRRVSGEPPFLISLADPDVVEVYYLGSRIRPGRSDIVGIRVVTK